MMIVGYQFIGVGTLRFFELGVKMVRPNFSAARSRKDVKRALVGLRELSVNVQTKGKYKRQMSCMKGFLRDRGRRTMTV